MVVLAADPYKKHVQNASGLLHRIVVVRPRVGPTGAFVTSLFVCLLACLSTISARSSLQNTHVFKLLGRYSGTTWALLGHYLGTTWALLGHLTPNFYLLKG